MDRPFAARRLGAAGGLHGSARRYGAVRGPRWFFETGMPAGALTLPPPAVPTDQADIAAIVASLEAYGTETLGPPPTR